MAEQMIQLRAHERAWIGTEQRRALEVVEQLLDAGARVLNGGERAALEKKLTLADVYGDWIDRRVKRGLRNTDNERGHLQNHVLPVLGELGLAEVRVRHVRDLVDQLRGKGLAARTVRSIYGTVHKLFADLLVDELLAATPCVLTNDQLPALRDRDPEWRAGAIFTRTEVELLISSELIPWDRRVLNAIKFLTGARFGEVAGLRWRDLDEATRPLMRLVIARSYAQATKTDTTRLVPVHPLLARMLLEWKRRGFVTIMGRHPAPDDLVVPSRRGRMRSRHQHRNKFLDDLQRLGLRKRRVHDTRRTFITLSLVDGARRDVLEQITHAAKRDMMDLYTTLPWPTLCEPIRALKIRRLGEEAVRRRLAAIREAQRGNEVATDGSLRVVAT